MPRADRFKGEKSGADNEMTEAEQKTMKKPFAVRNGGDTWM
jgi:hypothetical protein